MEAYVVAMVIGVLFLGLIIGFFFVLPLVESLRRRWAFKATAARAIRQTEGKEDADKILVIMQQVRDKYPDLRIGQLIGNALDTQSVRLYYIEDKKLLKRLKDGYDL